VRQQIDGNPAAFALLIHEAHEMGVAVSQDAIKEKLANATIITDGQPDFEQRLEQAVSDQLLVQAAFDRAADVVKVTEPERLHQLATRDQEISVDVVDFDGKAYLPKVAAPTEKEIAEQYAKYANVEPDANPLGFGYKLPNRVKFQYIELPVDQVDKAASEGLDDQHMKLYWLEHRAKYATTQDSFTLGPAIPTTSAPSTRPFSAVREQVFADMKKERASDLTKSILGEINAILRSDYAAFTKAVGGPEHPTSMPSDAASKAPATSLGSPYNSYDYLKRLALQIQEKYKILPVVGEVSDFQSAKDLRLAQNEPATRPTTGPATAAAAAATARPDTTPKVPRDLANAGVESGVTFPTYATALVAPLATDRMARQYNVHVISLDEPSEALLDARGDNWIFRISAIDPAHPQPLDAVRPQVDADARRVAAQLLAKADAQSLLAAALKSNLRSAATTRPSLKVVTTGLFKRSETGEAQIKALAPYELPNDPARQAFVNGAFGLLSTANPLDPQHPVDVIDLPQADRAAVGQLKQVKALWPIDGPGEAEIEQQVSLLAIRTQAFRNAWFNYNALKARVNYTPVENAKKNEAPEQPEQPPLNPLQ
jgi:hypothetical protein